MEAVDYEQPGSENRNDLSNESSYVPSEDEEYMNPRQLCYFKRKLIAWKNDLLDGSNKAREHLVSNSLNEPDVADRASLECDTFYELNNRDRNRKLIAKIDAALQRIEKGEYGYCEETGSEIGVKRLGARLVATLCIEAQEIRERQKKNYSGSDYGA